MMKTAFYLLGILCMAMWTAAEEGDTMEKEVVRVDVPEMQLSFIDHRGKVLSSPMLLFGMLFSVGAPLNFECGGRVEEQALTLQDSTGRKLGAVLLDLGFLGGTDMDGVRKALVHVSCPRLPAPDAEWVRLRGNLLVPLARDLETPLNELPLGEEKATIQIPLSSYLDPEAGGDVAEAPEQFMCSLSVQLMKKEGENYMVNIKLGRNHPFMIQEWLLFDAGGRRIQDAPVAFSDDGDEEGQTVVFRYRGELPSLKLKLLYQQHVEVVAVPVDVKIGLRGGGD